MTGGHEGLLLSLHVVRDAGSGELLDLSELAPIDEDEEWGEGRVVLAGSLEEVLAAAEGVGASSSRWVNQGIVGEEYADWLAGVEG